MELVTRYRHIKSSQSLFAIRSEKRIFNKCLPWSSRWSFFRYSFIQRLPSLGFVISTMERNAWKIFPQLHIFSSMKQRPIHLDNRSRMFQRFVRVSLLHYTDKTSALSLKFLYVETSTDEGECYFPYPLGSFQMNFCHKFDENLPSTCPTLNGTGPKINCSEGESNEKGRRWNDILSFDLGEYGYHRFEPEEVGSVSYQLNLPRSLEVGEHCLRFYYYFSDAVSNGTIRVVIENALLNLTKTIATNLSNSGDQWSTTRLPLTIEYSISNVRQPSLEQMSFVVSRLTRF